MTQPEETPEPLRGLRGPRQGPPAPPGPGCLPDETLRSLAAGMAFPEDTQGALEHAAVCDHCGPIMAAAAEDFDGELTPEEAALVASLPSSTRAGRRKLGKQFVRTSAPPRQSAAWRPILQWAIAAGLLISVAGAWWWMRSQRGLAGVNGLLVDAYTAQRTLEPRLAEAAYGPLRTVRGGGASRLSVPAALLEAELRIARGLTEHPRDPLWLDAKARADLLEGRYGAALESLNEALGDAPESPAILVDLASAYVQRGDAEAQTLDYGTAVELLGRALAKAPNDKVALFNRALAAERAALLHQAQDDWKRYLTLDSKGGWAQEARGHLAEVERELKRLGTAAGAGQPEQLLNDALEEPQGSEAKLRSLADTLASAHGDPWLRDFLASRAPAGAARSLAASVRYNVAGNHDAAIESAQRAAEEFEGAGNSAGALRARYEKIYGLHRSSRCAACLKEIAGAAPVARARGWRWLEGQLSLEKATCLNTVGELELAMAAAGEALRVADAARYPILGLRAIAARAGQFSSAGKMGEAWNVDVDGLRRYFQGDYPPLRAQQFYADMAAAAEAGRQWHLAEAVDREAVEAIALTEYRAGEGIERVRWGRAANMSGDTAPAEREIDAGLKILESQKPGLANDYFRVDSQILLAGMNMASGDFPTARMRLAGAETAVRGAANRIVGALYYHALATLALHEGRTADAERALNAVIGITAAVLASLPAGRDRLDSMRENSSAYQDLARLHWERGDALGALEIWQWALSAPERRTEAAALDYAALERGPDLPKLTRVAERLPALTGETVVTFLEAEDGIAAWVWDNRGVFYTWRKVDRGEVRRLVEAFRTACADPSSRREAIVAAGSRLYSILLAPVAGRLARGRTLWIEPDGDLQAVPFAALPTPQGTLGLEYRLAISPGSSYRGAKQAPAGPAGRALVVASPAEPGELADQYPPLEDAQREARAIAEMLRSATVLSGREATLPAVMRELPSAAIFHFAGHAVSSPARTGLLLAASGGGPAWWKAADVTRALVGRCRLVVLAACETAGTESFDSSDNLMRAFLMAGAPEVVASQWRVDSRVTAELMRSFYRGLREGKRPVEALYQAAARLAQSPATAHPYYWAAFSLYGQF